MLKIMNIRDISIDEWLLNEQEHLQYLENEAWLDVPLINITEGHQFKDGTLVRFRGMVQDMYGSEIYMDSYDITDSEKKSLRCRGKYRDGVLTKNGEGIDYDSMKMGDRHCYVVVSVPGLNSWVQQHEKENNTWTDESANGEPKKTSKRGIEEVMDVDVTNDRQEHNSSKKQQSCSAEKPEKSEKVPMLSREHLLNHPLGKEDAKVCHAKFYKDYESIKLNDEIEFVGFLSVQTLLDSSNDSEEENDMESQTHNPPGSLVPRIHVVTFKPLSYLNHNSDSFDFSNTKKQLHILFTQLLMGDSLSAEYLICHLISEVYLRKDFLTLGKFSLNISKVPIFNDLDYVMEFYKILELLVAKSHYLPFTLENMNTLAFTPKKDYDCNRVTSGLLQLSKNTHFVLDETKMTEGKLDSTGVQNVSAVSNTIKFQKVKYDFSHYTIDYDCDIPFLVFSEGKSLLPSDTHIPLQTDPSCLNTIKEILEAANHFLRPELLTDIRRYLIEAKLIEYEFEISDEVRVLTQEEFVSMRQDDSGVTAMDLHCLLVLGRLLCLSEGKKTLDKSCWMRACEMEKERKLRLRK
ncbi:mini-chromosome maintenance complex-binding protein [Euwallacea similis]|uniref:mini-chromosome maintenance complex-binding protein n=1 Tax=Euwallacea similis TaxID=1736056 RepID=UPI00344B328E